MGPFVVSYKGEGVHTVILHQKGKNTLATSQSWCSRKLKFTSCEGKQGVSIPYETIHHHTPTFWKTSSLLWLKKYHLSQPNPWPFTNQPTPSSPNPRHWACANLDPARSNKRCNSARLTKPSPFSSRRSKLLRSNLADNKSRPRKNGPDKHDDWLDQWEEKVLGFLRFMNLCTNDGRCRLLAWLFVRNNMREPYFLEDIFDVWVTDDGKVSRRIYHTHTHTHTHTTLQHIFPARRHCNSQWHEGTKAATKRENSTHPPPSLKRRIAACPGFFGTNRFNMDIFHLEIPVIQ